MNQSQSERVVTLNRSWFLFYGSKFGMNRKETLATIYSELVDMINCDAIDRGLLLPAMPEKNWTFDEAMNLL